MAANDFFSRWATAKTTPVPISPVSAAASAELPVGAQVAPPEPVAPPAAPTMADVETLTKDSDYSAFMARGVDASVQRSALKKLFTNPHFNIMDGLDIYIDDYNTFVPIEPAMLAMLDHAKGVLDPLSMFSKPTMQMTSLQKLIAAPAAKPVSAIPDDDREAVAETSTPVVAAPDAMLPVTEPDAVSALPPASTTPISPATGVQPNPQDPVPDSDEHTI